MPKKQTKTNLDQLLMRGFYWMDESLQRNLRAKGGPKVTHSQSMVILTIGEGVQRPSAIAERLGVSRQAVHQCLQELIRLKLVELVADPQDGRAKLARLSEQGMPVRVVAHKVLFALEDELGERIGKRNLQALRKALEQDWGEPASLK
tara:strand:+ start:198224 stop:198667 length:444 start_codon:yes stop_codon:yes gene_type:complete